MQRTKRCVPEAGRGLCGTPEGLWERRPAVTKRSRSGEVQHGGPGQRHAAARAAGGHRPDCGRLCKLYKCLTTVPYP